MTNRSRSGSRRQRIEPKIGEFSHPDSGSHSSLRKPGESFSGGSSRVSSSTYKPSVSPEVPLQPFPDLQNTSSMRPFWMLSLFVQGVLVAACSYLFYLNVEAKDSMSQMQQQLDATLDKSSVLEEQLSNTDQSFNKKGGALETKLFALTDNLDKALTSIDQLKTQLKTTENRFEARVKKTSRDFNSANQQLVSNQKDNVDALEVERKRIDDLAGLEDEVTKILGDLDAFKVEIDTINATLVGKLNWQEEMTSLQASVDSVDIFRQQTNRSLDKIEGYVRDINQRLSVIEAGSKPAP